jgi:hypothetical protein
LYSKKSPGPVHSCFFFFTERKILKMLRTTSSNLVKNIPAWRNASIYSSIKQYATPSTPAPATEKKEKTALSQRLGGSGRGKVMAEASSADPFTSFLANAKKPRGSNNNSDRRNGNFTPRPRKNQEEKGQFTDAAEGNTQNKPRQPRQPRQPRTENVANNNNNNNRSRQQKAPTEGAALTEGDSNKRQSRTNNNKNNRSRDNNNNNNNNNNKDGLRKPNNRRLSFNKSQPQEVRTRRATTFIDKDIDWASFDTTIMTENTEVIAENDVKEDGELLLKDVQGDYDRYIGVGKELSWPQMINGATISTLVGGNPTFDLSQKTAFMAAVSKATGGSASARK